MLLFAEVFKKIH